MASALVGFCVSEPRKKEGPTAAASPAARVLKHSTFTGAFVDYWRVNCASISGYMSGCSECRLLEIP